MSKSTISPISTPFAQSRTENASSEHPAADPQDPARNALAGRLRKVSDATSKLLRRRVSDRASSGQVPSYSSGSESGSDGTLATRHLPSSYLRLARNVTTSSRGLRRVGQNGSIDLRQSCSEPRPQVSTLGSPPALIAGPSAPASVRPPFDPSQPPVVPLPPPPNATSTAAAPPCDQEVIPRGRRRARKPLSAGEANVQPAPRPSAAFYATPSTSTASLESLADTLPVDGPSGGDAIMGAAVEAHSHQLSAMLANLQRASNAGVGSPEPVAGPKIIHEPALLLASQPERAARGQAWLRALRVDAKLVVASDRALADVFHFLVSRLERQQPMFTRGAFSLGGPLAEALADVVFGTRGPEGLYERRSSHLNEFARHGAFAARFPLGACGVDYPLGALTGEHRTLLLIDIDDVASGSDSSGRTHLGRRLFVKPEHAGLTDWSDIATHVWHYTQAQSRRALGQVDSGWDRRERVVRDEVKAFCQLASNTDCLPRCSQVTADAERFGALVMRPALAADLWAQNATMTDFLYRANNLLEVMQRRRPEQIGNEVCLQLDEEVE